MYFRIFLVLCISIFVLNFSYSQTTKEKVQPLKLRTHDDSAAYSVGYNVGRNIVNQIQADSLPYSLDLLLVGISDGILQKVPSIPENEIQQFVAKLQKNITERRQRQQEQLEKNLQKQAEENQIKAKAFLEENAKKDGVNVTQSGLQFKVLKLGTGNKPTSTSKVKVHYKGTLIDGTVFDESYSRGTPAEFQVDQLIQGFKDGLVMMPAGSKFIFYVPPELGYGNRQVGKIPPNSLLIFEVELLEVE
ncbi:MAG: FKBP-type peptidyl-prolyl cis-trans isomerase [Candidatus Kapaibacteriales bacterium]